LSEIAALKLDQLRAFHRDFYGASHAVVVAVGDFDPATLAPQLQKSFGDWTSKTPYVRVPEPALALPPANFRIEVPDKQNAVAAGRLEFPLRDSDADYQALRLAAQIFGGGGGGSGWLWDRVREKEGLSYGIGAYLSGGQFNANADWNLFAIAAPQNMDRVRQGFEEELVRARRDGFTADELERAKEAIVASNRLNRAQDAALASALESFVERDKTPMYFAELDALRARLTLNDVNAAFRKYILADKLVFGAAGDFANAKGVAAGTPARK
jgi:zinc protease